MTETARTIDDDARAPAPPEPPGSPGRAATGAPSAAEIPSDKGAHNENFPVGSFLIHARLRPHVMAYYNFARAIDNVADNSVLTAEEKIAQLNAFERAVSGGDEGPAYEKGVRCHETFKEMNIPVRHGADLCTAFRLDAVKLRYENWDELLYYCDHSANPVGRFLIDLHGEDRAAYEPSDALCTALQILNHLQDCGEDYREIDRVYVIQDWMREEGATTEELASGPMSPAMRRVLDRMLEATQELVDQAKALPAMTRDRRFAMECATIVNLAQSMTNELRKRDPLAERIKPTKSDFLFCGARGVVQGLFGRRPSGYRQSKEESA